MDANVQTIQFAWFVGHVLGFLGAVFYCLFSLKVFKAPNFPKFWYKESYVAIIFTFGIILFQTYKGKRVTPDAILKDDNLHYLLVAGLWLFTKPFVGTLPPFMVFSLFHILTYVRSYILPALGYSATSTISSSIQSFVKNYNDRFMMLAASWEFGLVFVLFFRFLTFRPGTSFPFLLYVVFIKTRHDQSFYTRNTVKNWEVRMDSLVGHPSMPGGVKQVWVQFKDTIRRVSNMVSVKKAADKKN
jgi:hypothetical protein